MKKPKLADKLLIEIYELMVKSRLLEERLIKIYKLGQGFFWIGGPGEEAFGVPLGLLVNKGKGLEKDYLHFHYRSTPTLVALGLEPLDAFRLMMNKKTDPSTGGRNFAGHYCFPKWNVIPVSSPIEVQYTQAIGTAHAQKRSGSQGLTVVTGGDAGTAEGDFASCLIWASRPGSELPLLITVQDNRWGISTSYESQHGEEFISHRGKAFGIKSHTVTGNDPIEVYEFLKKSMDYIRKTKKPVLLEFKVSRLYGHSSATGANMCKEDCCVTLYEKKLKKWGLLTDKKRESLYRDYESHMKEAYEKAKKEELPDKESVWDHVYVKNENADWRKF